MLPEYRLEDFPHSLNFSYTSEKMMQQDFRRFCEVQVILEIPMLTVDTPDPPYFLRLGFQKVSQMSEFQKVASFPMTVPCPDDPGLN